MARSCLPNVWRLAEPMGWAGKWPPATARLLPSKETWAVWVQLQVCTQHWWTFCLVSEQSDKPALPHHTAREAEPGCQPPAMSKQGRRAQRQRDEEFGNLTGWANTQLGSAPSGKHYSEELVNTAASNLSRGMQPTCRGVRLCLPSLPTPIPKHSSVQKAVSRRGTPILSTGCDRQKGCGLTGGGAAACLCLPGPCSQPAGTPHSPGFSLSITTGRTLGRRSSN